MDPDRSTETWRSHILRQLKHRDLSQTSMFQDLIRFYTQLLEKTSLTKAVLSSSNRRDGADSSSSLSSLQEQTTWMKKSTGELAYQVVELQQKIQIKTCFLQDQQDSLQVETRRLGGVSDACQTLQKQVDHFNLENRKLKEDYDSLLERQRWAESKLREQKVQEEEMLEKMLQLKNQAAARMNNQNERRSRARQATLQKDLQTAARSKVTIDSSSSAPSSRSTSPKPELHASRGRGQTRLFRKRRGHSVSSLHEDLLYPVGFCVSARVPARSLQVLEAHEQGINAVRFSFSSDLLATGGTDRIVKLWELRAGSLTHRTTLDGSTEGITCIEFDPMGQKVLAASYDRSALLWRVDDSVPKVTLTGHSRKVTAAKFTRVSNQVVTGSLDRTVRLWDLQRTACS
uniref:Autophagy related 16-like 2 n=1 Tax=Nothobranchius korthausae TaxID=1143690 RepID=A0A1A8EKB8_9TELE